jgi:hypothetical protein
MTINKIYAGAFFCVNLRNNDEQMIAVTVKARFFDGMYCRKYPTDLHGYVSKSQEEKYILS